MPAQNEMTPRAASMLILAASAILMIAMGAPCEAHVVRAPRA